MKRLLNTKREKVRDYFARRNTSKKKLLVDVRLMN